MLSVPLSYGGLRIAGKRPHPLSFFCYAYAIGCVYAAIFTTVMVIAKPNATDSSDVLVAGVFGVVGIVPAVIPLSVRAVRESKRPPAPVR